ncbi:hypothetical protein D3C71_2238060 [compost metagenome]
MDEPNDFSKMLARPPIWFPGLTLPLICTSRPGEYVSFHQRMRSTSFSPTSRLRARAVKVCSTP